MRRLDYSPSSSVPRRNPTLRGWLLASPVLAIAFVPLFANWEFASRRGDTTTREGVLPDDMSAFLAGGYLDGKSAPMRTAVPLGRDQFDGWYAAAGVEKAFGDNGVVGLAASFSELKGNTGANDWARARLYQGTVYGAFDLGGVKLDGVASAGTLVRISDTNAILFSNPNFTYTAGPALTAITGPLVFSDPTEAVFTLTSIVAEGGGFFINPDGSFKTFDANSSFSGNTVPTPGALLMAGLGGLCLARRRR